MNLLYVLIVSLALVALLIFWLLLRGKPPKKKSNIDVMIVLGSGGHTMEMMKLVSVLDKDKYSPRTYVHASTDILSSEKVKEQDEDAKVLSVPRAREVGQLWLTTVCTTLVAAAASYWVLLKHNPDLLLCNGPGTCVPFCFGAWVNNKLGFSNTKIVFIESICRVQTLSMSAKILCGLGIVDKTYVQWPELALENKNVEYVARFT